MYLHQSIKCAHKHETCNQEFPGISVQFPYADSCLNRQLADWNGSLMVSDESINVLINKFQNTRAAGNQNCIFTGISACAYVPK